MHALVFEVLRKGREGRFLVDEDFRVIVEGTLRESSYIGVEIYGFWDFLDVVHNHPGLEFLRDGIVFQKRYGEER